MAQFPKLRWSPQHCHLSASVVLLLASKRSQERRLEALKSRGDFKSRLKVAPGIKVAVCRSLLVVIVRVFLKWRASHHASAALRLVA
jgi:hypothetical protein